MPDGLSRESKVTRLVVWMNQPSHYQTAFFRELAARGVRLQVIYNTNVASFRRNLGWESAGIETYEQYFLRGVRDAVHHAWRTRKATHLVNGIWSIPGFIAASLLLLACGSRVYFHAEHPDPNMTRGGTGWSLAKSLWLRLLFVRARGLWAIGKRAGDFYEKLGVPRGKIHPFLYFTQVPAGGTESAAAVSRSPLKVLYLGQFVDWKRVEDIIQAIALTRSQLHAVELTIVGAGDRKREYAELVQALGLTGCTSILDALPPPEVPAIMRRSSVLVLPSRFDGWGLTVNEALQCGIPAVCSSGCGVAELLEENPQWGLVFPTGDVAALADALVRIGRAPDRFRPNPADVERRIGVASITGRFLKTIDAEASLR